MLQKSISNLLVNPVKLQHLKQKCSNIICILSSTKMRKNRVQVLVVSEAPKEDDDEPDRVALEQKHDNKDQDQGRTGE